jgi:hypothetical protein
MINPKSRNQNSQYDLISHYVLACFPLSYFDPILNILFIIQFFIRSFLCKKVITGKSLILKNSTTRLQQIKNIAANKVETKFNKSFNL